MMCGYPGYEGILTYKTTTESNSSLSTIHSCVLNLEHYVMCGYPGYEGTLPYKTTTESNSRVSTVSIHSCVLNLEHYVMCGYPGYEDTLTKIILFLNGYHYSCKIIKIKHCSKFKPQSFSLLVQALVLL